uniref:C-C motif chemokine n=1 Tax=Salmo trutta TaxID=8032 RepID=A0A674AC96_SALTR
SVCLCYYWNTEINCWTIRVIFSLHQDSSLIVYLFIFFTARRRKGCCQSYTGGEIPFGVIVGYTLQTPIEICRIPAIIFHTEKGKDLCADPSKSWVIQHVNRLGDRAVHIRKSQS